MAHIIQESRYPKRKNQQPLVRLPSFLTIILMIATGLAMVMVGAVELAHFAVPPSDPFPAYAHVFPGAPASVIKARAFSCQSDYNYYHSPDKRHDPSEETCTLTPAAGIISSVEVKIFQGVIRQTNFTLRDDTLQVGDLAILLKMPNIHGFYRVGYFFTPNRFIIAKTSSYTGQFSLFRPVQHVSFTDIKFLI